jgi:hypothetical protein
VTLPPGWERLDARRSSTGSDPKASTIGIVEVASFVASAVAEPPPTTMTAGLRLTKSAASAGFRSKCFSAQRYFKHKVLAFDEARFPQTCTDAIDCARVSPRLVAVKEANNRHGRLLRARNQRPRDGRAAECSDKVTPPHWSSRRRLLPTSFGNAITPGICERRNGVNDQFPMQESWIVHVAIGS